MKKESEEREREREEKHGQEAEEMQRLFEENIEINNQKN